MVQQNGLAESSMGTFSWDILFFLLSFLFWHSIDNTTIFAASQCQLHTLLTVRESPFRPSQTYPQIISILSILKLCLILLIDQSFWVPFLSRKGKLVQFIVKMHLESHTCFLGMDMCLKSHYRCIYHEERKKQRKRTSPSTKFYPHVRARWISEKSKANHIHAL